MPSAPKHAQKAEWLRYQQECARWLYTHDGPDPAVRGAQGPSKVGKVARVSGMQYDLRSLHYCGECKWADRLPVWLRDAWKQIVDIARHNSKAAVLMVGDPGWTMHLLTPERHAELLGYEREVCHLLDRLAVAERAAEREGA